MEYNTIAVILGLILIGLGIYHSRRYPGPLPPGPRGWPIIGSLLDVGNLPYETFTKWSKKYGPLISVRVGSQLIVVVNDIDIARDLFIIRGRNYNSRSQGYLATEIIARGGRSITMAPYGDYWRLLRKLVHSTLHPYVVESYQPIIEKESRDLVQSLLEQGESGAKSFDPATSLVRFSFNTILTMSFGYRVKDVNDPVIEELKYVNDEMFGITSVDKASRMLDLFPILRWLPTSLRAKATALRDRREGLALKFLNQLKEEIEQGVAIPCFAKHILENQGEYDLEELDIVNLCAAMMIAGSDGPSIMLMWFTALMANHPGIQERIHEEMDQVVGRDRVPLPSDESKMPYLRAVIKETMRYRPKSFLGIAHATSNDDTYKGYFIPKNTIMLLNSYTIDFDPKRHKDPHQFNPDRYLGVEESAANLAHIGDIHKRDHFAFGIGRRGCPGIFLAERELFCVISRLLWAFRIEPHEPGHIIDVETVRFTKSFSPLPYDAKFIPRHENVSKVNMAN
ncbi:cytochrome P450 [Basidiobolus meristosporus CBS 931.73]|uniref:Cytochrome P450 n=1 Tax=Basidiobolus meristosporus CBS 931.73 TaxID=1314790 RepID=A0A1Y1Y149_9FUNG|nr:cytochrome P450 [Basidiobolus meristosporus CBS 931.73]|eukprot:ORX91698.1 cytochrome P450 [Basidiobolus meristosporus CBS 931.73]